MNKKKTVWLITAGTFLAFFLFGFTDNMKGATLSAFLADLGYNYSTGGTVLSGAYVGFLAATLLTGALSDIAGRKIVLFIAAIALIAGILGFSSFGAVLPLYLSMMVLGAGLGAIELGCNSIIVDVHGQNKGKYLNLLSFFHGLGSTVAPYYAGQLLASGTSWRSVYQLSLAIVVLLPLLLLFTRYPKDRAAKAGGARLKGFGKAAFGGDMLWFYALIMAYCAAEIGIGSWLSEFLQKTKGQTLLASATYLTVYFGLMMCGRLIGSFLVERIGYLRIMMICSVLSVCCLTAGILGPAQLAFLVPAAGLFFSIMFPTATAAVTGLHGENMGTILGIFFAFAGLGGLVGPWLMGIASDIAGIQAGFGVVLVYCLIMILVIACLMRRAGRRSAAPAQALADREGTAT